MHTSMKGSVTVRIKGGLGNQLFQYASGKALAHQLGSTFYLDTSWFLKPNSKRQFKLPDIGINSQTNNLSKSTRSFFKLSSQALPGSINGKRRYLSEPADYDYHVLSVDSTQQIYMDGYWQSEKYFADIREQLMNEIDLSRLDKAAECVEFPSDDTVAVHIRRGDYITQNSSQALSIEYVNQAMACFGSDHDFMFFSDDINWCKDNFKGDKLFFANNRTDLQDLKQMSEAKHNIIANSTFSWWSAWLNKNENQRVIAPQPWTTGNTHNGILPAHWETITLN